MKNLIETVCCYLRNMKNVLLLSTLFCYSGISAQDQFSVLLYTQQDTWHYECIPSAVKAFHEMAERHQFKFDWTQDAADFTKKLPSFDVVVFLNTHADGLNVKQLDSLKNHVNDGGGFVGIHSTSDSKIRKPWFDGLVGGVFKDHPQFQAAVLSNIQPDFPSNLHLSEKWLWSDEWYNFSNFNIDKLNVVLTVDEASYDYEKGYDEIPLKGMGESHPIAWYQFYDGGKSFYTALGHKPDAFENQDYLDHIFGGIYWAATATPENDTKK